MNTCLQRLDSLAQVRWLFCCTEIPYAVTVDAEVAIMAPSLTAATLLSHMNAWAERRVVMAAGAALWPMSVTCQRSLRMNACVTLPALRSHPNALHSLHILTAVPRSHPEVLATRHAS